MALREEVSDSGIGLLTLDRPDKRNALNAETLEAFVDVLARWRDDEAVRVVVIAGEPPAFCAGFDRDELFDPELLPRMVEASKRYHRDLWSFPKPTIAAVGGPAFGGGFDLAVLCDMRLASSAAAFAHPEIKFGAPPLFTPLRWIVGDGLARDLVLTGRRVGADEAAGMGLVSRVVAPQLLAEEAEGAALSIAEAPHQALEITKRYLVGNQGLGFEQSFRVEHDEVFDRVLEQLGGD